MTVLTLGRETTIDAEGPEQHGWGGFIIEKMFTRLLDDNSFHDWQ
jgi:hypothetical protein